MPFLFHKYDNDACLAQPLRYGYATTQGVFGRDGPADARAAETGQGRGRAAADLMRASDALPPAKIAELTGLSIHSVQAIHSRFLREGEDLPSGPPWPWRPPARLAQPSPKPPLCLLRTPRTQRKAGWWWPMSSNAITSAWSATRWRPRASTAGWRKVAPRPSHLKKDPAAEAVFKKFATQEVRAQVTPRRFTVHARFHRGVVNHAARLMLIH